MSQHDILENYPDINENETKLQKITLPYLLARAGLSKPPSEGCQESRIDWSVIRFAVIQLSTDN